MSFNEAHNWLAASINHLKEIFEAVICTDDTIFLVISSSLLSYDLIDVFFDKSSKSTLNNPTNVRAIFSASILA